MGGRGEGRNPHQPGQLNSRAFPLPKENRGLFFAYRWEKYNIVGDKAVACL
jgi:hypothetical protein